MHAILYVALAGAPAAGDAKLQDLKQFHNTLREDLEAKQGLANHFLDYAHEKAGVDKRRAIDRSVAIALLREMRAPGMTDPYRLSLLRDLRNRLSPDEYSKGRVEVVPAKCKDDFRRWLKENDLPPLDD